MARVMAAALAAITPLVSPTCLADWQYSKFGMTVDELVAASGGKATAAEEPKFDRLFRGERIATVRAKGDYTAKNFDFDVYFNFDVKTNQLTQVTLYLRPGRGDCDAVIDELRATYGKPNQFERSRTVDIVNVEWRSEATGNLVSLNKVGTKYCAVRYEALPKPGAGGL